jgi:hypothetical protein
MRHETWVSVKAREVIDRAGIQLNALVQGHRSGAWPDLKGRTVIVNGQRLSACIVTRQVLWIWTESDGSVTIALMEEVSRTDMQGGEHTN